MGSHYSRRGLLKVGGAVGFVATLGGCIGDDDGSAEDDEDTPTGDDDDQQDNDEQRVTISEEFDSFVLESEVKIEDPDGDIVEYNQMVRSDSANQRMHVRTDVGEGDEDVAFHFYRIDDSGYQLLPDGSCNEVNPATVDMHADQVSNQAGGFRIPTEDDFDAENLVHEGTRDVNGVEADQWVFDLGESIEFADGELKVYIATETNYLVRITGWYPIGPADDQGEISFDQHYHSFNQELDIEVPDACEA